VSFRKDTYAKHLEKEETKMSLTLKNDGNEVEFKILDPGTHAAVCTGLFDFGPQVTEYNGEEKEQDKVRFRWEVPAERIEWTDKEGVTQTGPMTVGKTYTASMYSMATLRQHLESWRGREFTPAEEAGFDLKSILGAPCMLTVQHDTYNGKKYAKITGIGKLTKGLEAKAEGELMCFDFDTHTEAELDNLADWMKEKVMAGKVLLKLQRDRARADNAAAAEQFKPGPGPLSDNADDPGFDESEIPF
jgi:hypothetical protein